MTVLVLSLTTCKILFNIFALLGFAKVSWSHSSVLDKRRVVAVAHKMIFLVITRPVERKERVINNACPTGTECDRRNELLTIKCRHLACGSGMNQLNVGHYSDTSG